MSKLRYMALAGPILAALTGVATPAYAGNPLSGKVVVVDPGHGGRDPGAVANGLHEENITLAISRQLAPILQAQGATVILTRSTDREVVPGASTDDELQARVQIARTNHASAFVSIHGNEIADPGYSGATTYYGTACGYYSGAKLSATDVGRSYALAQRVQSALVGRTHEIDRGSKAMPFWVLGNAGIPAILVETGFLSNKAEAGNLADPGYQHLVADAIADGVSAFFASSDPSGSPAAPASALACGKSAPVAKPTEKDEEPEQWVQTFVPAPLLSGADTKAKDFGMLPPFSFLKVLSQKGSYFYVLNPLTNGPGYIAAAKVGPSGPPAAASKADEFQPFWVESFRGTTLWSGVDSKAKALGSSPAWQFFEVLTSSSGSRFQVRVAATGGQAFIDRADVGPSGPPPTTSKRSAPAPTRVKPAPVTQKTIVVQPGDTLTKIGSKAGVAVATLISANHLAADGAIRAGQTLILAETAG